MNDEFDEMMSKSFSEMNALRATALMIYDLFQSYIDVGFSEDQAMELVKASISAASAQGPQQ